MIDTCEHADCGQTDDHPKFHALVATLEGQGWKTYHHDCAALLGHVKASLIVKHTDGVKGEDLRALLLDGTHPVHEAVAAHTAAEQAAADVERAVNAGQVVPS